MPVLPKRKLRLLTRELGARYAAVVDVIKPRELRSATEGAGGKRHWVTPNDMAATIGDDIQVRMAVEDFKNILAEIKKLK